MTPESGGPSEVPAPRPGRFDRIPTWARLTVPVVLVGVAAVVVGAMVWQSPEPATAESLCRSAAETRLESRGRSDIEVTGSLRRTEVDGAQRVSGTVTFDDESGATHHEQLRCVIRLDGDAMRVTSVRFSE